MQQSFAPGKIILSGEYAVVFGHAGIAVPSHIGIHASFEPDSTKKHAIIAWKDAPSLWQEYAEHILIEYERVTDQLFGGTLKIETELPLGRGMGSSTALIIAIGRALLGTGADRTVIETIEDHFAPHNSGIDFEVIWQNKPLLFRTGETSIACPIDTSFMSQSVLIDTGSPNEPTAELVADVQQRSKELQEPLNCIATCTERLLKGEDIRTVMPDHNKAQVVVGVVPKAVQGLITTIEQSGGCAKVIGAGSKTGGGGMVLAVHKNPESIHKIASSFGFSCIMNNLNS